MVQSRPRPRRLREVMNAPQDHILVDMKGRMARRHVCLQRTSMQIRRRLSVLLSCPAVKQVRSRRRRRRRRLHPGMVFVAQVPVESGALHLH